jgi:hypothetical protein
MCCSCRIKRNRPGFNGVINRCRQDGHNLNKVSMIISSNMRAVAIRTSFLAITFSQCQMRVPRRRVSISVGSSFCSCASSTTSVSRCISSSVGGVVNTSHANWASVTSTR